MARKRNPHGTVQASSFVLVDSAGRPRAILSLMGDAEIPTFQILDADGATRIAMQVEPPGRALINVQHPRGYPCVGIGADADGAGLSIYGPGEQPAVQVRCETNTDLHITVWDKSGRLSWQSFRRTEIQSPPSPESGSASG